MPFARTGQSLVKAAKPKSVEPLVILRLPHSIRGSLLREFALSNGRRRVSVIVQPHLVLQGNVAGRIDLVAAKRSTAALKRELSELDLLERTRFISDISGCVLEVTPRQLRLVAELPSVQAIRPNMKRMALQR